MNQQTSDITNKEAAQALDSITSSKLDVVNSVRPPILLMFLSSFSYAAIVFGYGMTEHENLWALAMWGGAIGFALFTGLYIYTYRLLGIKISIIPKSSNSVKMNIIAGAIFAILVIASREVRLVGFAYAPHFFSSLCGFILFYLLKKYPTGEYVEGHQLESTANHRE